MSSDAIEFKDVSKIYSKAGALASLNSFLSKLKDGQILSKTVKDEDFIALNSLNFAIKHGEKVGVIGPNGAGKSTLLKLIQGITHPTSGAVRVQGQVGGLIELGSGFHQDLTCRENVLLNGAMLGFDRKSIEDLLPQVLGIADLHDFADVPIKRLSSGMKVRLGFAVAISAKPEVILLDEVLAVGDKRFREKSFGLVENYLDSSTVVFVSHNMSHIRRMCDRAIVLDKGTLLFDGEPSKAISEYETISSDKSKGSTVVLNPAKRAPAKQPDLEIQNVEVQSSESSLSDDPATSVLVVVVTLSSPPEDTGFALRFSFRKEIGGAMSDELIRRDVQGRSVKGSCASITFTLDTNTLTPGRYAAEISVSGEKDRSSAAKFIHKEFIELPGATTACGLLDLNLRVDNS